ncbi:hypothetical protein IB270_07445 [Ensifer sp. ENS05]|uniref:hypothetical protein n=1 Tax=Ensifer sp. ENS05 TaxID=2769277 RepID=UPI0017816242|nr:hypothetical protein [Ensifer sp. ENS05]MBD9592663.1 hypothetical protein [Ensifer sp. ENS05]
MTEIRQSRFDVLREIIFAPLLSIATFAVMIAVFFAPLVFFVRAAVFLYSGEWVWSLCDVAGRLNVLRADQCSLSTGYLGFDQIANLALAGTDATLGLLLVSGVLLVGVIGVAFFVILIGLAIA